MDFKKFWKETFAGFILKNLLLAIAIIVALSWGTLIAVGLYTHHGEEETIPDLRGLYPEEAEAILSKHGLRVQVIDSVYVRDKKLGIIIDQVPQANSMVKQGRAIYLIINSKQVKQVPLPEIMDVSYRQADAMLRSVGLNVISVRNVPSEYKDLVLELQYNGRTITPGARLPEGSSVVLLIGNGLGQPSGEAPSLIGLSLDDATTELSGDSLSIGTVEYDEVPNGNESDYVIYRQQPSAGSPVSEGATVDVWLTTDKGKLKEQTETEDKKAAQPKEKEKDKKKEKDEDFF